MRATKNKTSLLSKITTVILLGLLCNTSYGQPPNDCIFNAISLDPSIGTLSPSNKFDCNQYTYATAISQPTQDNVNGNNTPCDGGPDYRDVWFTFTVTATSPPIWVDAYSQGMDIITALYSGTPGGTCGNPGNITGLTYIDCSDNGFGGPLDVSTCTTPLHSRLDCSSLPIGTYYLRVWEWNGGTPPAQSFTICVEDVSGDGVTSDECPGGPTVAITSCPNTSISDSYLNLSNAGMMGNACNTNTNEPQLAAGAAGNYQNNCTGTNWTGIGYVNNVMNNSAIYGFEINATPGCDPTVEITFDNMQYGGVPGNVAQIQVVSGPCSAGSAAVMLGTTTDNCFSMTPTSGTLPSGQYFIVVDGQDGQLIQYDLTVDIQYSAACESNAPTPDFTVTSPICDGQESTITYTGNGTAADTYIWDFDGGTVVSGSGMGPYQVSWTTPGTYEVTLETSDGTCSNYDTMYVTVNPNPTVNIVPTDVSCFGGNDGSATANTAGGTAPYTYSWNTTPVQTTITASNLNAGNYTVTITDANGCQSTANTTINEPTQVTVATTTVDANCGLSDGSATATPAGGTAGYTYSWNTTPVQTTATASNLAAGNYTVTVTDANGCTANANITINNNGGVIAGIAASTDVSCFGGNDGSATANTAGGTAPYTYSWNTTPVQTTITASNLNAGNYTVTITDANGCQSTANTTINEPTQVTVATTTVDANCGLSDGSATATPAGGTAGYTYSWNTTPVQTTATASNLAAGNYTVTVTDANGCTANANITINNNGGVTAGIAASTDVSCFGGNDGSATANTAGGTAPYTYSWNTTPVQTTITASNLNAGNYTVTITDANGCQSTANTTINEPTQVTVATTTVDANCGLSDGSATATPAGGTAGYTYSWNTTPVQTTATASNLAAGNYTVTVTDANGCTANANITINNNGGVTAGIAASTDVSCFGGNDGSATANTAGGTAPYTYSWNTTPVQTTITASNLNAGNYTVTITDANGCQSTANTTINEPTQVTVATTTVDANCGLSDGSATATPAGGTAGYTYSWNTTPVQTTATASNLAAGNYTVTVTDANGCTANANITINNNGGVTAGIAASTDVSCFGGNDGSATANTAGGTAPYTYSWNTTPVQTTITASNLNAGNYTVTITDANGCQSTANTTINEPTQVTVATTTVDANCGLSDGSATATPAGGTAGYTYSWNTTPVQTTATASNLAAGNYTVTVTDANGCTANANITINNNGGVIAGIAASTDVSCFGGNDGSATANTAGGTAPYTYSWNTTPVQTTITASNLNAGNYTVTITDANGCQSTANTTINEPTQVTVATTTVDANCGLSDGSATATPAGGTAGYTYSWNTTPVQTTATASNLAAGNYTVTVTDANGCTANANITINNNGGVIAGIAASTDVSCFGGNDGSATANTAGGTAPYTYSWNTTPVQTTITASNLNAGNYTVTITDANGCQSTANTTINEPTQVTVATTTVDANCGLSDGSATATPAGGTAGYTYSWNTTPVQTTATASNLAAGNYTVTVTDANGCTANANITINNNGGVTAGIAASTDVSCFGGNDGSATANTAGGTAPYTYSWNTTPVQTTITASNLNAGNYTVTITDANGCQSTANTTINEPTQVTVATTTVDANCGLSDGSATATPAGGTAGYTYSWNTTPVQTTATASNLAAGNYTVTVTDANGCTANANITINNNGGVTAGIAASTDVSCFGGNDGSATANTAGGTAPYTYSWNTTPVQTTITASNLNAGNYTVTITDANGCQSTANTTINEPTAINLGISTNNSNCNSADGSATVTATNGTAPYTYAWSTNPVQTTATANNLTAGNYTVTVTDANGCSQSANAVVGNTSGTTVSINNVSHVTCNGGSNGSASASTNGGVAPFTYSWNTSPVQTTQTVSQLPSGTYIVTVTDANGCTSIDSVEINQPSQTSGTPNSTGSICYGQTANLSTAPFGGTPGYTFDWSTGETTQGISVSPAQDSTYWVFITDANNCVSDTQFILVQVSPELTADILLDSIIVCENDQTTLSTSANGGNGNYVYNWAPTGNNNSSFTFTPQTSGWHYVIVSDGCTVPDGQDSIYIQVAPLPSGQFDLLNLQGCAPVCVTLSGQDGPNVNYEWLMGDGSTQSLENFSYCYHSAGIYDITLNVSTQYGCMATSTQIGAVEVFDKPVAQFTPDSYEVPVIDGQISFEDESFASISSWDWDFGDGQDPSSDPNPTHLYDNPGVYDVQLIVTNANGCSDTTVQQITITDDFNIFVPNAFTPNGDGTNDIFQAVVVGIETSDFSLRIFDRWGQIVFETNDPFEGWDGTYKGSSDTVKDDVYVWQIKARQSGQTPIKVLSGHVTVLK